MCLYMIVVISGIIGCSNNALPSTSTPVAFSAIGHTLVDPGDDFVDGGTATSKAALLAKVSASVDLWQDQIDADDPTRNAIAMYVHDIDSHWNPPGSLLAETADNQTPPHMLSVLLWTGDIH